MRTLSLAGLMALGTVVVVLGGACDAKRGSRAARGVAPEIAAAAAPADSAERSAAAAPADALAALVTPPGHAGHQADAAPQGTAPQAVPPGKPPDAKQARGAKEAKEEPRAPIDVIPEQQTRIGLETKAAVKQSVRHAIRAVGSIVADDGREAQIHSRVAGFIEEIAVATVGAEVKRGQVLYRLYAPELVSTQQELIAARKEGELGRRLTDAALERLALWNVAPSEIEALKAGGPAKRALAFLSPANGFVVSKQAVKGAYVTPDVELYRIADLSKVWVIVSLYENELPLVAVGDMAVLSLAAAGGEQMRAPVSYIYPELDTATRTGRARIEVDNRARMFKPGMFANVAIEKELGEAIVVPEDALIFTGQRNLVFKKTSETRFTPVEVTVGPRVEGGRVILTGVQANDAVVVRASFLIDAESRLQAALEKGGAGQGHTGHGG